MSAIRVMVVDDHNLVRSGFRALLEKLPGMEVVGEAQEAAEALELARALQPDVVLMDVRLRGRTGLSGALEIRQHLPATRVLMLSVHADEEYIREARRAGASGYLLKTVEVADLERAVRTVATGGLAFWAIPAEQLNDYNLRVGGQPEPDPVAQEAAGRLTARQREVLVFIARGETTTAIARQLGVSPKTVETHRMKLMNALNIHDVPGLTRFAIRAGLVAVR